MGRVSPDLARAAACIAERGCPLGRPLYLLDETPSTNDEARQPARKGAPHGSTWVAESQTAGRGRQGRPWMSAPRREPSAVGPLASAAPTARLPLLAIATGVAVCEVARRVARGADVRLKWPNDVVLIERKHKPGTARVRKLAGILVETSMKKGNVDTVIIGVGLNVHTRSLPSRSPLARRRLLSLRTSRSTAPRSWPT